MSSKSKAERISRVRREAGRLKLGVRERRSARKLWALAILSEIASARRLGNDAEAERLYRGAWPEKWAAREARRKAGLE
jgi:hypothetical protein